MGIGIVIALIGAFASSEGTKDTAPDAATQASAKADEEKCSQDIQCYGAKSFSAASVYCRAPIERLAKYEVKWTDAWYEQKFRSVRWLNKEAGTLTYMGDKAKFQNGFGAYRSVTYQCDLDPKTNTVLDVRVQEDQ